MDAAALSVFIRNFREAAPYIDYLRGKTLDAGLAYQFRAVAVQSRQEIQDRRGIAFQYLRRQVDAEGHIGLAGFGKAAVLFLMAVEHFGA